MVKPSTKVYRRQIIEGFSVPAIVHNYHYFFVDIDVYENGRVEYWDFKDFESFAKSVASGRISLSIPEGEVLSIHGLGDWKISDATWTFNKETFIKYVKSLVKELNPKLENIYEYSEKTINGVVIGESGKGTAYKEKKRVPHDIFPEKVDGESLNLFYKVEGEYYLIKAIFFADNSVSICRLENPLDISFEEFEELIAKKIITSEVPNASKVHIYGLGSFNVTAFFAPVDIENKLQEIKDILRKLNGVPSTIQRCKKAHQEYIKNPTSENKEYLKSAYENVPDHQKMYVGDMDAKDIEVRMIIYGEQEIENWSHYQASKATGEKTTDNKPA